VIQADAGARVTYVAVPRLRDSIRRLPRDFPALLARRVEPEAGGNALADQVAQLVGGDE
jgi:hypothetical protein